MAFRVVCSVCNAENRLPHLPADGAAICPRCGERYIVHAPIEVPDTEAVNEIPSAEPTKKKTPIGLFLFLSVLFVTGFAVMIWNSNRPAQLKPDSNGQQIFPRPTDTRVPAVRPPKILKGWEYLPPTVNIVAAVQPGPVVLRAGRDQPGPEADADSAALAALSTAGVPTAATDFLKTTGLKPSQIETLFVGITLAGDNLFPGVAILLELREPLTNEAMFFKALNAERQPKPGPTTYNVKVQQLPLQLRKIDATKYLFGLTDADLVAAEKPSRAALDTWLPAVTSQISPASFLFLATAEENWAEKPALKLLLKDPAKNPLPIGLTLPRQLAIGLGYEPQLKWTIAARTDAAGQTELRDKFLAERLPNLKPTGEAPWTLLQLTPEQFEQLLRKKPTP
ncbi:MAG: hypothetical protein ACRCZF_13230 [Gemmataceae bacterium]